MTDKSETIRVFVSYSHDSQDHLDRVRGLSDRLRHDGIDCLIDQYEVSPPEGWPAWMAKQIRNANFVLVVCTQTYLIRFNGEEEAGKGLGARWESMLTMQGIHDKGALNPKFVPVYFDQPGQDFIPDPLKGASRFNLGREDGYAELFRRLLNIPPAEKPPLGELKDKFGLSPTAPLPRKTEFLEMPEAAADRSGIHRLAPFLQAALKPTTLQSEAGHPDFEPVSTVGANFRILMTECIRPLTRDPAAKEIDILVAYRIGDIHLDLYPLRSRPDVRLRACLLDMWDDELMNVHRKKYFDRTPQQLRSRVIDSIGGLLGACEFDEFPLRLKRLDDPPAANYQIRLINQRITYAYYRIDQVAFVIPLDMKKKQSPPPWGWVITSDNAPKAFDHYRTEYNTIFDEAEGGRVYPR